MHQKKKVTIPILHKVQFKDKIYLSDLKLITLNETLVRENINKFTPFVSNYFPQNINKQLPEELSTTFYKDNPKKIF